MASFEQHRHPPSLERLRRGSDFRRVMRTGRRLAGTRVVLYVLPREGLVRAGFISGRRIGGAVVRNRVRRLMKEAWRSLSPMTTRGFDLVFASRPEARGARMQDVADEMQELLATARVIDRRATSPIGRRGSERDPGERPR